MDLKNVREEDQRRNSVGNRGSSHEFQAVILAGGFGNRLYPLVNNNADLDVKALLPVANRPLLSFQLQLLEQSGFSDVIIVTQQSMQKAITRYVTEIYKGKIRIQVEVVDGSNGLGTADALREIRASLYTDFFVISSDLVTDVFIHYLADIHRANDAAVTALLFKPKKSKEEALKKKSKKKSVDIRKQYIGLDNDSGSRLCYFRAAADIEDQLRLTKKVLRRFPNLTMHSDLDDAHLYIFSHWILDYLDEKPHISSIQGELIPYLVNLQFKSDNEWIEKAKATQAHHEATLISHNDEHDINDAIRCYAYVANDMTYCARVNTVEKFMRVNRDAAVLPVTAHSATVTNIADRKIVGANCIIGTSFQIGEKTTVKKSNIGAHCKIGDNVKIANSILMDYVSIDDNCNIQNSVLCANVHIGKGSKLNDCQIGARVQLEDKTSMKGEALAFES